MASNEILPFCPTDTGSNLLTQSQYAAAADRTDGNQPGTASSKLVNKAIRQSAFISSQFAQFLANKTTNDVLDDANAATLLATIVKAFGTTPVQQQFLSGSGTYHPTTVGGMTPIYIEVEMAGGGAGGAGSGTSTTNAGGNGGNTTFGTSLLVANGGHGAVYASDAVGGTASLGTGPVGRAVQGENGQGGYNNGTGGAFSGPRGGATPFSGAGGGNVSGTANANDAIANTGSGGGSGSQATGVVGTSGAAGGYVKARISGSLLASIIASGAPYAVGAGGTAGAAATGGNAGGAGAAGVIYITEYFN